MNQVLKRVSTTGLELFSSTNAGKVFGYGTTTIKRMFDDGRLKGYRKSDHQNSRMIPRAIMEQFLKEEVLPQPTGTDDEPKVLLVTDNWLLTTDLEDSFNDAGFILAVKKDVMGTDMWLQNFKPDAIILDWSLGNEEVEWILEFASRDVPDGIVRMVLLPPGVGLQDVNLYNLCDEIVQWPHERNKVTKRLKERFEKATV